MADVAPGILTNGLGADQTAMIIGPFRLGFFKVEVVVERVPGAGGGPYPGDAWNKLDSAWDLFKPTSDQPYPDVKGPKIPVTIRVTLQNKVVEKVYLVTPKHTKILVQVLNIVNRTRDRIVITVKNIMHRTNRMLARVTNIHSKSSKE